MAHIVRMEKSNELYVKENLKWLIAKAKTNAYLLAEATKVPQPTIHRIITGESSDPRTSTLAKIAEYFGVSVADLRDKDLSTGLSPPPPGIARNKRQQREEDEISDIVQIAIIAHELPLNFRKQLLEHARDLQMQDVNSRIPNDESAAAAPSERKTNQM